MSDDTRAADDDVATEGDPTAELLRSHIRHIGGRVRELRRDRLTLVQLAAASGVSIGLLSRLENGSGNPSFGTLSAIARALGVDASALFRTSRADRVKDVNGSRLTIRREGDISSATVELLVPSLDSRIAGVLLTLPPAYDVGTLSAATPGRQYEFVLSGDVEYRIDHEVHQLAAGDFIRFDAGRPHLRRNMSAEAEVTILCGAGTARFDTYFPAG